MKRWWKHIKCAIRGYHNLDFKFEHPVEKWWECRDCGTQQEEPWNHESSWFRRKILGFCPRCRRHFVYPKRRHMHTAYVDEESNYCEVCLSCFEEIEAGWDELWDDYNSGRL